MLQDKLHQSSEKYQHMSQMFDDVRLFARYISRNQKCFSCRVSKMKLAHTDPDDMDKSVTYTGFRFDLSGPVELSPRGIGVESDSKLFHVFIPSQNSARILRQANFHLINEDAHPPVNNFMYGLSRQHSAETSTETESDADEDVHRRVSAISFEA